MANVRRMGLPAERFQAIRRHVIRRGSPEACVLADVVSLTAMEATEWGDPGGEVPALSALAELKEPDQRR